MKLSEQFRAALAKAEAIQQAAEAKGAWTPEDQTAYTAAMESAKALKAQIENAAQVNAMKQWADSPDGQSVVKNSWTDRALPGEGEIPGVTADASMKQLVVDEKLPEEYKALGAAKLKIINSGAYKDAFAAKLRAEGLYKNWQQHVEAKHMKVLQEGIDASGGDWVPPDMRTEVISKIATIPGVMQDTYQFPTGSNQVKFPKVVWTTDDLYTNGIQPAWTAESPTSDISESTNPVAGEEEISIYTMTASVLATRAMLEDGMFDILGYIASKLGENIPLFLNNALINGDGVGKPQGFLNHALATTLWSSGGMKVFSGASGALAWGAAGATNTGLLGIEAALPPQYEANAKWYATKNAYGAIRSLNVGTANLPQWGAADSYPNFANGMNASLLGYPIKKDQFMPAISSTTYPIAFGDLKGYYVPTRVGLSIEVLRELKALRDMVVIYARMRVGGKLVEPWRLKLLKSHSS